MPQIKTAMVLLAFGPSTTCPPYVVRFTLCIPLTTHKYPSRAQKYFDKSRWAMLSTSFRYILLTTHNLAPLPTLCLTLHTGLAALKTPTCFSTTKAAHNIDCPVCSQHLGKLAQAKAVPWSHHVNSTIVCKVTGKVMMEGGSPSKPNSTASEEGREPMALPNGRVYSLEAMEALAMEHPLGKIKDPATGEVFDSADLRKVFIS